LPYDPAKEEKDSPKEELHGGARHLRRCAGEGGLLVVTDTVGEVVEVHGVVEELLSATTGSERVWSRPVMEELLAAVEVDGTVGGSGGGIEGGSGGGVEGGSGGGGRGRQRWWRQGRQQWQCRGRQRLRRLRWRCGGWRRGNPFFNRR
jgi:hypothetical protein